MFGSYAAILLIVILQTQPLDDVLSAVSKNVSEFDELVPDFVCTERITASASEAGQVRERRTVDSLFSESRKRGEQREIMAIDGMAAKKNAKMPHLPTNWNGTFSGALNASFSQKNLQAYNYSLASKPDESGKIILQFETRKEQDALQWTLNGEKRVAMDTGEAWIDPRSMQVVHMERHFLNLPRTLAWLVMTTDYGPVTIDEKQFWLPKSFRVEGENPPNREKTRTFLYTAEFTNCRKFGAEIRIVPH